MPSQPVAYGPYRLLISLSLLAALGMGCTPVKMGVATAPTPTLRRWEDLKYGLFIHYGMSTFMHEQFGRIPAPSTAYAPTGLDTDQWARVAKDAGMTYAVLTVKHHYGHALWPSDCSDYDVTTSSDHRDVVKSFVNSCRKYGIKPGFYYSIGWDKVNMGQRTPTEYETFMHTQMKELLTRYGPITELWFDIPWDTGADMRGALDRLYRHCKSIQPNCLILLNQGFVDGSAVELRKPTYIGKPAGDTPLAIWPKDINNGERVWPPAAGHNPWIEFEGAQYYIPDEVCDSLCQERWFWGPEDDPRPARQMYELYRQSVGRKANLLLNIGPDKSGRMPPEYVQRLMEVGELIRHPERVQDSVVLGRPTTASNVYHGDVDHWGPQRALDMDITAEGGTRWATDLEVKTAWLEIDLGNEQAFNRATLCEYNESVRAFEIQIPDGQDGWKAVYRGQGIGGLGVEVNFPPTKASKVRLAITDSAGAPTIWDFALYPPR